MLASKPERRRANKGHQPKKGDKAMRAMADFGRMALGGHPKVHKPRRPPAEESFSHALSDPFSVNARGARVPDLYAFPTSTFRLQTSMLLGAGLTEFGACFLPNPYVTAIDTGQAAITTASVTSLGGMRRFANANAFIGLTTPAIFIPLATAFRVVGGGIKIRNLLPELTATGRVYIACLPVASNGVPNWDMLETANPSTIGAYNNILDRMGLPKLQVMRSAGLQMENVSKDYTIGQLVGDAEVEVEFSVFNPEFFSFKPTDAQGTNYSATISEADDIAYVTATGAVLAAASGDKTAVQSNGGSAIIVWFEGVPSTVSAPIEIDVCLHLECVPLVATNTTSGTTGLTPESDNPPRPTIGSTAMVEREITRQLRNPDSLIRVNHGSKGAGGAHIAEID